MGIFTSMTRKSNYSESKDMGQLRPLLTSENDLPVVKKGTGENSIDKGKAIFSCSYFLWLNFDS